MLSRNRAKFAVCVDRYRKLFPCVRQTSTPHLTCHWLRTCRGIAEISKAAIPSNDVSHFRDIYLATSSCQRWAFLATCDTPESSDATLRIIRIELEGGTRVVLFRVLIRITRVCAYRILKITPFSRSSPGRRMRFPRDAKSLNSFRYRNFPDDALLHANSEHFPRASLQRLYARYYEMSWSPRDFTGNGGNETRCKDRYNLCYSHWFIPTCFAARISHQSSETRESGCTVDPGDLYATRFLSSPNISRVINDSLCFPTENRARLAFNIDTNCKSNDTTLCDNYTLHFRL